MTLVEAYENVITDDVHIANHWHYFAPFWHGDSQRDNEDNNIKMFSNKYLETEVNYNFYELLGTTRKVFHWSNTSCNDIK